MAVVEIISRIPSALCATADKEGAEEVCVCARLWECLAA